MITSPENKKIKEARALLSGRRGREKTGDFVVEGVRLAEEAQAAGLIPEYLLFTTRLSQRGRELIERWGAAGAQADEIPPDVMDSLSDTETSQGILAVITQKPLPLPNQLDFIVVLDTIRDPGNLGTILRSARAAGAQAAITTPGTTDAFAPRALRGAMGAQFYLPIISLTWEELTSFCHARESALRLFLADSHAGTSLWEANFRRPCALVIGGEANGCSAPPTILIDERISIPMPGGSESLNAAMAAGILFFEVVRQRSS